MKKVALIGANGQLGSDIVKIFSLDSYFKLFPLTHKNTDITDKTALNQILQKINPDIIINTAAYHKVDELESNEEKAFKVNTIAQKNLAAIAETNKRILVFISSDYVFGIDRKRKTPYQESDIPGPINTYGVAKAAGEHFTRYICKKHFIIRSSGLFGIAGASGKGGNFVDLMIKIGKEKGEVSVVYDQVLTPTYTKNMAENMRELLKTDAYGTYHMTSQGQCSWWEFASEIFHQLKMPIVCHKVPTSFFKTSAERPKYSVLENYNLKKIQKDLMDDWRVNLKNYLREKGYRLTG